MAVSNSPGLRGLGLSPIVTLANFLYLRKVIVSLKNWGQLVPVKMQTVWVSSEDIVALVRSIKGIPSAVMFKHIKDAAIIVLLCPTSTAVIVWIMLPLQRIYLEYV